MKKKIREVIHKRMQTADQIIDLVTHEGERDIELRIVTRKSSPQGSGGYFTDEVVFENEEPVINHGKTVAET